MKRIIFMGTPDFAVQVLQGLIDTQAYEIVGVVTQPDRPVGRKRQLRPTPVKELALAHDLPIYQPERLPRSEDLDQLIDLQADLIITAAYGQFLPTSLLDSVQIAAINVHASLLPKYRGGAPIHYALWKGEEETGITIMYMTKQMDAGDIISQRSLPITPKDDVGTLFERLALLGRDLLLDTLPDLIAGQITPQAQDESQATYSPNITREQEQLNWNQPAQAIDWQVRAFRPFPSSYTWFKDERVKIWAGEPLDQEVDSQVPAGTIVEVTDQALRVACGDQKVYAVTEWQESGKRRMPIASFLNGVDGDDLVGQAFVYREPEVNHEG